MNRKKLLVILFIFFIAFAARFYKLGEVPNGVSRDESSIGYNAYSILKSGKDEYGQPFPLNFKAFGEYKLPVSIYLTVPSIAISGNTPLGVRFPFAVMGFLTVVVFYFLLKNLSKNEGLTIISTLVLSINPWHIHFSRAAFEVIPALFFIVLGVYLFMKFTERKQYWYFLISGTFFILSMYSYNICRVFSPLLFLTLLFYYRKTINFKEIKIWLFTVMLLIFLIPFVLTILKPGGFSSTQGTLIYSSASVQAQLLETRSIASEINPVIAKLIYNKWFQTSFEYFKNIISYFSPSFLFVSGSVHGNHGIGNVGMFYLFEFITITVGLFFYFRRPQKWIMVFFIWMILSIISAALTREAPHATRGFFLIPPLVVLSSYGIYSLITLINNLKLPVRYILTGICIILISYNIVYYFTSYYLRLPLLYGESWHSKDKELANFISNKGRDYENIIFDESTSFVYTTLLFHTAYPPDKFQKEVKRGPDDSEGFSKVHSFDKFSIRKINWDKDLRADKTLIITSSKNIPSEVDIIATIYYPKRPVVIADGQNILQYPTQDIAYVLIKTE